MLKREPRSPRPTDKLHHKWYVVEDAKTEDEKNEVAQYYLNEVRIWRSLRRILRERFASLESGLDLDSPNLTGKVFHEEGRRKELQELYNLIPRPRENTDE